jgi:hypothetical protein
MQWEKSKHLREAGNNKYPENHPCVAVFCRSECVAPENANCPESMVSAAGFEPATHALKGHCSTN